MVEITFSVMASIEATRFFVGKADEETVDWRYCMAHATFRHKDACEFLIHAGPDYEQKDSYGETVKARMRAFGCTNAFINAFHEAAEAGALDVCFYV